MDRSGSSKNINNGTNNDVERMVRSPSDLNKRRSMIRPERQRLSKNDPHYYYNLATEGGNVSVRPSSTGNEPYLVTSNSVTAGLSGELAEAEESAMLADDSVQRTDSTTSRHSRKSKFPLGRSDSQKKWLNANLPRTTISPSTSLEPERETLEADEGDVSAYSESGVNPRPNSNIAGNHPDSLPNTNNNNLEREPSVDYSSNSLKDEKRPRLHKSTVPKKGQFDPWNTYCKLLTFPIPGLLLKWCGMKTAERQMAWREKIGLISLILLCGAFVGYLTFGFTQTVCYNTSTRIKIENLASDELVISGAVYSLGSYEHPGVEGISQNSPILYPPVNAGGKDASFMFQNVNGNCKNLIKAKSGATIPHNEDGELGWYFPCQLVNTNSNTLVNNSNLVNNGTTFYNGWGCHTHDSSRSDLYSRKKTATIYYTWEDLANNTSQFLVSFNGDVLNLSYLDHLLTDEIEVPELFQTLRKTEQFRGRDISQDMAYGHSRKVMKCLREIAKVGEIDTEPIGCIASKVVLYVSLVFIMGLVIIKFLVACYFRYFMARYQGAFPISESEFASRERNIENWGDNIYSSADQFRDNIPVATNDADQTNLSGEESQTPHPTKRKGHQIGAQYIAEHSRSSQGLGNQLPSSNRRKSLLLDKLTNHPSESVRVSGITMSTQNPELSSSKVVSGQSLLHQPVYRQSIYGRQNSSFEQYGSSQSYLDDFAYRGAEPEAINLDDLEPPHALNQSDVGVSSPFSVGNESSSSLVPNGPVGGNSEYTVPQPPLGFQPFGYPLAHVICMVTAYSESVEGLRTTLDSICTTDYPNSHKLITIVCDGLIKGSGNDLTTPEICLSMMKEFSEPKEDVKPYSYVSVVSGEKRHNMAKVYAGFYNYDDTTVPLEKQQRVPIICIVKCGTPKEAGASKPGNRGKRDSQVILMSFLQHVMFDERMTELDFEIFNGIRSVTGIAPDYYEMLLMVDADTKVFPDCMTHMCAEMVRDPEIMGLCGETKIANKMQSWVTMIQVFEYFISHHQAKGFESVFGWVSCLPGCFSMYRIKSPKGADGYWVPILCNPDIVERYSDNNITTLHRKNLLLLGEDRYLSTLMAKTFPKRKTIFVPKAACKTIVPDEFKVLLSQRRRWINSTIHNLFELVLVRDSCGVFVISMQFVVFVDLISTLVLPAAIAFTLYVVIIACIRKPTPILSLVLLAMILGLPGVLIVVTAARASYILWMGIYLLALPIWNFVLPVYAYWKFDDFSWGDTRAIAGGDKGHEEANGEFDSSQIVMKRWREFQYDRARDLTIYNNSTHELSLPHH